MSRLEAILYGLCEVVIEYCAAQMKKKPASLTDLLKKNHKEFIETLEQIIMPLTLTIKTRSSLLEYFIFEINILKPLIDKKPTQGESPLQQNDELWTAPEKQVLRAHLIQLIDVLSKLLALAPTDSLRVVVSNKEWHIFGLKPNAVNAVYVGSSRAAKLIKNKVISVLGMPWTDKEHAAEMISQCVNTLMTDHCNAMMNLILTAQNQTLQSDYKHLLDKHHDLTKENEALIKTHQNLHKELVLSTLGSKQYQAKIIDLETKLVRFKEKEARTNPNGISIAAQTELNLSNIAVQTEVSGDDIQAETDAIETLSPNHVPLSHYYRHPFSQSLANLFSFFPLYKSHSRTAEEPTCESPEPH